MLMLYIMKKEVCFFAVSSCPENLIVNSIRCNTRYNVLDYKLG